MNVTEILCLALALAIDVFGISFAYGLIIKRHRIYMALRLAVICGLMQALMPVFGYFGTAALSSFIASFDYMITFVVFSALGINVIREAVFGNEENVKPKRLTLKTTLAIGVATSIDALVSGSMIYLTKTPIISSCVIIGIVSFLLGIIGFNLNYCFKKVPEKYLQIFAGLILIGLGAKSLISHFLEN